MAQVTCACGNAVRFGEERRGSKARCPACGASVLLDENASPTAPGAPETPVVRATARLAPTASPRDTRRPYLLLLLTLLPLFLMTFFHSAREISIDPDGLAGTDKLPGALLARHTIGHWVFAAISAASFLGAIVALFPRGTATPRHLLLAGAFTGTIGIVLLLLLQMVAAGSGGFRFRGRGGILIIVLLVIGYSYSAALNPENGFLPSFVGFTLGVGFCEELTKALPLLHLVRFLPNARGESVLRMDWRTLCALGLASGVGFGVSEGITYSADYYNGVEGPAIYVVRFVSCVALHAMWAASAGLVLSKRQETVQGELEWAILLPLAQILAVPMVLHGLYDTLLKRDMPLFALGVAIASFFWLVYCLEIAQQGEPASSTA
jgi:RsiW-degrading membrane proteinase PrsW (M82 family)